MWLFGKRLANNHEGEGQSIVGSGEHFIITRALHAGARVLLYLIFLIYKMSK